MFTALHYFSGVFYYYYYSQNLLLKQNITIISFTKPKEGDDEKTMMLSLSFF